MLVKLGKPEIWIITAPPHVLTHDHILMRYHLPIIRKRKLKLIDLIIVLLHLPRGSLFILSEGIASFDMGTLSLGGSVLEEVGGGYEAKVEFSLWMII